MLELYEQLTPTKVYHARKTQTNHPNDTLCRLCGKTAESIPHVLASCSALAQNKKTIKPGPLRWELKQQFPGYDIWQYNIIIDVLEGWSPEVDETMRELFGARGGEILLRIQRAVISYTLNIARTLKVMS